MDEIKIKIKAIVNLPLEELNEFQDDIKVLEEEDYQAFKASILAEGFSFSPAVFQDSDDKWWLLDGHQRKATLTRMKGEGYYIPTIPCVDTEADSLEHARRMVLMAASQYGTLKEERLREFLKKAEVTDEHFKARFRIRTAKLTRVTNVKAHLRAEKKPEVVPTHTCPNCGTTFAEAKLPTKRVRRKAEKVSEEV